MSRFHFTDVTAAGKRKKDGISETVLIMSNWHHNRDVMEMENPTACKPENCSVQIKISSTAFINKNVESNTIFHFDKNGINIPYSAFVYMCDNDQIEIGHFIEDVKKQFNNDLSKNDEEKLEEEDLNTKKAKKSKK